MRCELTAQLPALRSSADGNRRVLYSAGAQDIGGVCCGWEAVVRAGRGRCVDLEEVSLEARRHRAAMLRGIEGGFGDG